MPVKKQTKAKSKAKVATKAKPAAKVATKAKGGHLFQKGEVPFNKGKRDVSGGAAVLPDAPKRLHEQFAAVVPRQNGRPIDLTWEIIELVERTLPHLLYMETIGRLLGVCKKTWYDWLSIGARTERKLRRHPEYEATENQLLCVGFLNAFRRGKASAEALNLERMSRHAERDWRASSWLLRVLNKKRYGEETGTKVVVDASGKNNEEQGGVRIYIPANNRDKPTTTLLDVTPPVNRCDNTVTATTDPLVNGQVH